MSRTLGGIAVAVAALALASSGIAASPSTEGLHGAAIRDFTEFGFQGKWQLSANAQRLPTGDIAGELALAGTDLPLSDFFRLSSKPTYVEHWRRHCLRRWGCQKPEGRSERLAHHASSVVLEGSRRRERARSHQYFGHVPVSRSCAWVFDNESVHRGHGGRIHDQPLAWTRPTFWGRTRWPGRRGTLDPGPATLFARALGPGGCLNA